MATNSPDAAYVAVLYAYADGVYADAENVDLWDEARDARNYHGPYPVVAHPPCKHHSLMGLCRGLRDGEDGGCFEHALGCVRAYGGVIEHPAHSLAWELFNLPKPAGAGWTRSLFEPYLWTCEVDQRWYGHEANKPTWLCFVGGSPPELVWGRAPKGAKTVGRSWGQGRDKGRSGTPPAFADVLLGMARTATCGWLDELPEAVA